MIIGVPKEIKPYENRVAITPAGVRSFVQDEHTVYIEHSAGTGSGFTDDEFVEAGAKILSSAKEVYNISDMVVKVKEPLPAEYEYFHENLILFTYLHLAPEPELTRKLLDCKVTGIAYETVQLDDRSLPLLSPMSEVAGRMSVQVGAHLLEKISGGRGILIGGVPGVEPANVVIVGGGVVGTNAAKMAVGLGGRITILDISVERLEYLDDIFGNRVTTMISNPYNIAKYVKEADLLIGAVLIPGARAPKLVTEKMVESMRAGAVIVDVAIDQGGSIETIDHVTTHADPYYIKHNVVHYSVANMPGAVPRTSTFALTNATLPYALRIANKGALAAMREDHALLKGLNTFCGNLSCKAVAEAQSLPYTDPQLIIQ
ncbi:MAG: alanine dehydrogenase [Oscillospiraceae bacterium]|nr:alanine dehydrogenase [Oscillospiraceae bacterium]